ncbi:hypothetical protein ACI0FM_14710 [Paenochrobactrum sp. BZR 588]|uniref:hypothetical protein n=1 Tax=unclassified Paenochrobactrum TaxID=2639760 RepID=UPI003854F3DA
MSSIALNSTEHILLKVPTCDGFELLDPRLKRGASYQDVADEATGYDAIEILRLDMATMHAEDITDTVALHSNTDALEDVPLWLQNSSLFGTIFYEAKRNRDEMQRHERSFRPAA